jgi:hypothetical protein
MKYRLLSTMLAITCATAAVSASAETLFRPRVSLGFSNYELAFTQSGNSLSSVTYLKGGIGATIATGQLYFDAGYSGSMGAKYDDGIVADQDFLRNDLTLTVGYVLPNNITVFGGYKSGTTEYTDWLSVDTTTKFEASGPYFGAGIGMPVGEGVLSFNGAIAVLSADLTDNDPNLTQFNASGDSVGLSLGAGYSMTFGGKHGLAFKASYQVYDYTGWTDPNYTIDDTQETILAMDVEYYYNF